MSVLPSRARAWPAGHRAAVLLVVGCLALSACATLGPGSPPTPGSNAIAGVSRQEFILRLVGFCAGVNERLAGRARQTGRDPEPGVVATELNGLVESASAGEVPSDGRAQFDRLISALTSAATRFRQASTLAGDGATQAKASAQSALAAADTEAVRYGMPHLKDCADPMGNAAAVRALGTWQARTPAPTGVQQVGTAVIDQRIWVVGGLTGGQPSSKIMIYDPVLDTWTPGPDLPIPLHHAMAVAYQGDLVVLGGFTTRGDDISVPSALVYRLRAGDRWEQQPALHHARAAAAAVVVGQKIIVIGGRDERRVVAATEQYDGSRWQDAAAMPIPGDHVAAVTDGAVVYAVGGRTMNATANHAALQRYDPAADRWTALPPMPVASGGLGVALLAGAIVAVGGEGPTSAYATVQTYDLAASTWSTDLPRLPGGLHGMAVAGIGERLYTLVGSATAGHADSTSQGWVLTVQRRAAPSVASTASTATASASAAASASPRAATVYDCPDDQDAAQWVCLTSARVVGAGLTIAWTANFTPAMVWDGGHSHLHFFTANPAARGGTDAIDAMMQPGPPATEGSWFNVYTRGVTRIDAATERGGLRRPLDLAHASLLCVRVSTGLHRLAQDRRGGHLTGNCVSIAR